MEQKITQTIDECLQFASAIAQRFGHNNIAAGLQAGDVAVVTAMSLIEAIWSKKNTAAAPVTAGQ